MRNFSLRATLALILIIGMAPALAADPQVITIPVSRPGEPISLEIGIMSAHITIIGEDRDDVTFEISVQDGERKIITPSGTKILSSAGYALEVEEHDNHISLDTGFRHNKITVVARIPKQADLDISTINDGEITVTNISGNLELANVNGPITASGISGSVIAEGVNATIDISFISIDDVNATSLESMNGDLILRLPANAAAQIHLDTSRGQMISDFEVDIQPSAPTVERNEERGGVSVRIESVIIANINGGGPVVRMKTMHGDINILKSN